MGSYIILQRNDKLPTVAVLQKLLNRAGADLKVDAHFGPKTEGAVRDFQGSRRLFTNGIVGSEVWSRLSRLSVLPIVDCVDVFHERTYEIQAQEVIESGGDPILLGGMSNGLAQAATDLGSWRSVFLLRFIGHGAAGIQGISIGLGGWMIDRGPKRKPEQYHVGEEHSRLHVRNAPRAAAALGLKQIFGRYASVEMHGCHVAEGKIGHLFVKKLAIALDVPVTAGIKSQRDVLRFNGPTFTYYPAGIANWCASLPDFSPITVP